MASNSNWEQKGQRLPLLLNNVDATLATDWEARPRLQSCVRPLPGLVNRGRRVHASLPVHPFYPTNMVPVQKPYLYVETLLTVMENIVNFNYLSRSLIS